MSRMMCPCLELVFATSQGAQLSEEVQLAGKWPNPKPREHTWPAAASSQAPPSGGLVQCAAWLAVS